MTVQQLAPGPRRLRQVRAAGQSVAGRPLRVGLVAASDLVAGGLAAMLAGAPERVRLVRCDLSAPGSVDIVLVDVPHAGANASRCIQDVAQAGFAVILVFSAAISREEAIRAREDGAHGHLSTRLPAGRLIPTLEAWQERAAGRVCRLTSAPTTAGDGEALVDAGLTGRELEVITLVCSGLSNAELAEQLGLSSNTVKTHIRSGYRKIGLTRRSQVVAWGLRNGL